MGDSERFSPDRQHEADTGNADLGFETRELSHVECWRALGDSGIGHLALSAEPERVDVIPINYLITNRQLFFRSGLGTKLEDIVLHPYVAVQAERLEDGIWKSVVLKGKAIRLVAEADIASSGIRELIPTQAGDKVNFVRVIPDSIIGRSVVAQ